MENASEYAAILGPQLRQLRELRGYSPEKVHELSGEKVSAEYIRKIERGGSCPSAFIVKVLCEVYETTQSRFYAAMEEQPRRKKAS